MFRILVIASVVATASANVPPCGSLSPVPLPKIPGQKQTPLTHAVLPSEFSSPNLFSMAPLEYRGGANKPRGFQYKTAIVWTFITLLFSGAVGVGVVLPLRGKKGMMDFFTGFVIEKTLSVDNLFVFVMFFNYFKTPEEYQRRVLNWGIIGAIILRGFMIGAGVKLVEHCKPVLLVFALFLFYAAYKAMAEYIHGEEDSGDLAELPVMKFTGAICKKFGVEMTDKYDAENFWSVGGDGVKRATPMLVVLVCVELSDVMFAVDSIPAIMGITQDPLIIYLSNICAILGLRQLYVLLAKAVSDLEYLKPAVSLILFFVAFKMVLDHFDVHVSSETSLTVVMGILLSGVVASLMKKQMTHDK